MTHPTSRPLPPRSARLPRGRASYVVTCLAGHGIGPEVTAAASRALAQLSRQHGFRLEEVHPPFDTEAITHSGHPLPAATRRAAQQCDAVLVAGADAPALAGVRAELDLAVAVTRVLDATGDSTLFSALDPTAEDAALQRAFARSSETTGSLTAVGVSADWDARVEAHADRFPGVRVEHLPLAQALRALSEGDCGVVAAEFGVAAAVADAPRIGGRERLVARAELALAGPGLFTPTHGTSHSDAGHGMADPSEMLLATALLLSEGLGRRAAGEALEHSLSVARTQSPKRPAGTKSVSATSREFVDAVLALLPSARRDTEFALELGT